MVVRFLESRLPAVAQQHLLRVVLAGVVLQTEDPGHLDVVDRLGEEQPDGVGPDPHVVRVDVDLPALVGAVLHRYQDQVKPGSVFGLWDVWCLESVRPGEQYGSDIAKEISSKRGRKRLSEDHFVGGGQVHLAPLGHLLVGGLLLRGDQQVRHDRREARCKAGLGEQAQLDLVETRRLCKRDNCEEQYKDDGNAWSCKVQSHPLMLMR